MTYDLCKDNNLGKQDFAILLNPLISIVQLLNSGRISQDKCLWMQKMFGFGMFIFYLYFIVASCFVISNII